jgi:hypothetical protein
MALKYKNIMDTANKISDLYRVDSCADNRKYNAPTPNKNEVDCEYDMDSPPMS